jgi:DNA-binding NarL/FixJ family response regulator
MEGNELRILVVADDPLARLGLASLLNDQPGCAVVGQITGESDLPAELDIYQPDLILCDLGWNPIPMLERLGDLRDLRLPVVLLLSETSYAAEAWSIRPQGLLLRETDIEKLLAALQSAAQGLITLDPDFMASLLPHPAPGPPLVETLTPRELEVLQLLAEGLPNKAIAQRLEISEHTVKFHVNAIMSKLAAQSRTEAVVRATQLGLIML